MPGFVHVAGMAGGRGLVGVVRATSFSFGAMAAASVARPSQTWSGWQQMRILLFWPASRLSISRARLRVCRAGGGRMPSLCRGCQGDGGWDGMGWNGMRVG